MQDSQGYSYNPYAEPNSIPVSTSLSLKSILILTFQLLYYYIHFTMQELFAYLSF